MITRTELRHDEQMGIMDFNEYESSTLGSSLYVKDQNKLLMTFKSGTTYSYANVDEETYEKFIRSESHGSAFNKLIKTAFEATKLEEAK